MPFAIVMWGWALFELIGFGHLVYSVPRNLGIVREARAKRDKGDS